VTDHASREVRLKRLTREEGIELVKKYQSLPIDRKNVALFLEWVGLQEGEFWPSINDKRDQRIWDHSMGQGWRLKDSITEHLQDEGVDRVRLRSKSKAEFQVTVPKDPNTREDKYVLIGKGYVETDQHEKQLVTSGNE
jgi:hypothetical protein